MSDQIEDPKPAVALPASKRRRAAAAKPKKASAQPQQAKANDFEGLTARSCCGACNEKRCVITGAPFCGHPLKASHPTAEPAVMARIIQVKNLLAHQRIGGV